MFSLCARSYRIVPGNTAHVLQVLSFLILVGLLVQGCTDDPIFEESLSMDVHQNASDSQIWQEYLDKLVFPNPILVPRGYSIQEAVDVAQPGDAILIESGSYSERIRLHKRDITLVGLPGPNGEGVTLRFNLSGNLDADRIFNIETPAGSFSEFRSLEGTKAFKRGKSKGFSREKLTNGIVHYTFPIRVGGNSHEVVALHRVVKEEVPGKPDESLASVFMLHGSSQDFGDIFLYPGIDVANSNTSCPVFLAEQGFDVWGIDLAWTRIPANTTDFSIMKDWGVDRDVEHVRKGMAYARLISLLSGHGFDRMHLLGFSYGGVVAYGAAGAETQVAEILKHIKGLLIIDVSVKFDPSQEANIAAACNRATGIAQQLEMGIYQNNNGQVFSAVGGLALTQPTIASPIVPNLTNYQTALFFGANTYLQPDPNTSLWHFVAGDIDQPGIPASELLYTDPNRWLKALADLPPYMPARIFYELNASQCGLEDVAYDDYLDQITVPILNLAAAGGFGQTTEYTLSLTSSTDVTNELIQLEAEDKVFRDFAHGDLFLANNASTHAWIPISEWLSLHQNSL